MASSADVADLTVNIQEAYIVGPGSKSYDLSTAGGKEIRLPCQVDSSWKKVSNTLSCRNDAQPYFSNTVGVIQENTVNDLTFTSIGLQVVGSPAAVTVGTMFMEYDVEFDMPISTAYNY